MNRACVFHQHEVQRSEVLLQEYSYSTTVIYKLSYTNREARIAITALIIEKQTPILLLFSGQSLYPLGECINFLNNVFLLLIHKPLLHGINTGVWCAMSATRRTGRCFVRR
jgi:hypothetical protein